MAPCPLKIKFTKTLGARRESCFLSIAISHPEALRLLPNKTETSRSGDDLSAMSWFDWVPTLVQSRTFNTFQYIDVDHFIFSLQVVCFRRRETARSLRLTTIHLSPNMRILSCPPTFPPPPSWYASSASNLNEMSARDELWMKFPWP